MDRRTDTLFNDGIAYCCLVSICYLTSFCFFFPGAMAARTLSLNIFFVFFSFAYFNVFFVVLCLPFLQSRLSDAVALW